jgi:hypothetical protein
MKINEEIKDKFPWGAGREWKERTQIIASIIPKGVSVLDLGGGFCHLKKYLSYWQGLKYLSMDIEEWTDCTIKADFNKGEFPDRGEWQIIVCQGIIEYIKDPIYFLEKIKKYGETLIITYLDVRRGEAELRGRLNFTPIADFEKVIELEWEIVMERKIKHGQKIYYCKKK